MSARKSLVLSLPAQGYCQVVPICLCYSKRGSFTLLAFILAFLPGQLPAGVISFLPVDA